MKRCNPPTDRNIPFAFSQGQVRIFCLIVEAFVEPVIDCRHDFPLCRPIRAELVGDDPLGRSALLLLQSDQQSPGSLISRRP